MMKRCIIFLISFFWIFISCNSNSTAKIVISTRYQDYPIDHKNAKEEVFRSEGNDMQRKQKNIAIDSTRILPHPMIDEMKNEEYMVLVYNSTGCFHEDKSSIIFKKKDSKIYGIVPGQFIVELTSEQIEHLRKFESLISQINNNSNFCTTVNRYKFYLGNRVRTYFDETCEQNIESFNSIINNLVLRGVTVK